MFDLNDSNFGNGGIVFNNGIAGKVDNVKVSVEKKKSTDPDNIPDYKLIITDHNGSMVNQGFYYHDTINGKPDNEKYLVQRVVSAARAIVPADVVYPEVTSSKEALDVLFKMMAQYQNEATVNVYITYGTVKKPSKYLGLRFFQFIEKAGTPANESRLKSASGDNLVKFEMDQESVEDVLGSLNSAPKATTEDDWFNS